LLPPGSRGHGMIPEAAFRFDQRNQDMAMEQGEKWTKLIL
jgi:hypothetical protein